VKLLRVFHPKIFVDDNQKSLATYYKLKNKYYGMTVYDLKRLKELEVENCRLRTMYADISLDNKILKEVFEKSSQGSQTPMNFWPATTPYR